VISIDLTGRHLVRCLLDHYQEQSLSQLPSSSSRQPGALGD